MDTQDKPIYKRAIFWILIAALVVLAVVFVLVIRMSQGLRGKLFTPSAPVPETSRFTVPTLPPPEENPYGAMDFGPDENGYLTCLTGESRLGIDVSYAQYLHQDHIDWQQVKDAGIEFVIIKVAGRGYGEAGKLYFDDYWRRSYEGAKAAGLDVGAYFFSQAITEEEAIEEANYILAQLDGLPLDMPIVYDWEYIDPTTSDGIPRTHAMSKRLLTECTKAFCETIKAAGYEPMIYFNADQSRKKMYLEELTDYPFWLASYTTELNYPYKVDMWQYTATGSVPGIEGDVDLNLYLHYD